MLRIMKDKAIPYTCGWYIRLPSRTYSDLHHSRNIHRPGALKHQFRRYLPDARLSRPVHHPKRELRVAVRIGRVHARPLRVIERVERISAEVQMQPVADRERLRQ